MSKEHYTWLVKSKSFIQLVGAEYHLLKKSGSRSILKFYMAAILIILVLLLTFSSIFYATEMLFHLPQVELLLAGFISLLFVFIYIFLLNTFSKQIQADKKESETQTWYRKIRLANLVRIGFVVFMAFLIAKPIEIFFFQKRLESRVMTYRQQMFDTYQSRIKRLNEQDEQKLSKSLQAYVEQYNIYPTPFMENQIKTIRSKLVSLEQKQTIDLETARLRIWSSDFLLYQIQTVSTIPFSWLVSVALICLFLVPGYLVYSISRDDTYYKLKQDWERKLITEEYTAFCRWYTAIFQEMFNLGVTRFTVFEDPPFNQFRKSQPSYQPQDEFTRRFSSDYPS